VRGRHWLVAIIGAVFGVCFAALAALSISVLAITPHYFRLSSLVFTIVSGCFSYLAFRAATSGRVDEESFQQASLGGLGGAFAGFIIVCVAYLMFRQTARAYFAHPLGVHFSQLTMSRLLISLVCLGFGAGFSLRMQTLRRRR
jgi:hypothetical protein